MDPIYKPKFFFMLSILILSSFILLQTIYAEQHWQELSPRKQVALGVEFKDIKCKNNFQLVIKATDNSPACVKPQTAEKLVERVWAAANEIFTQDAEKIVENDLKQLYVLTENELLKSEGDKLVSVKKLDKNFRK